jgi:hypothetical protein
LKRFRITAEARTKQRILTVILWVLRDSVVTMSSR